MNDLSTFTFVDVETTGMSPKYDRIIEIALLKVAANRIIGRFETVLNPGMRLPPEITVLTGIREKDLTNAPAFGDIAERIRGFFTDTVIVAHNARFDYRFLTEEFRRLGMTFRNDTLCTVRLFRKLYPGKRSYSLDSMIETFSIRMKRRHRAYDDARALWDFFKIVRKDRGEETLSHAIGTVMRKPSFPPGISAETVDRLPESPGVYVFRGSGGVTLYIGKAINVKERVISHFHDTETRELSVSSQITGIDTIPTAGELSALLLEKQMVSEMKPLYNRRLRKGTGPLVLVERERNGYLEAALSDEDSVTPGSYHRILGVFSSKNKIRTYLETLTDGYDLCPKLLGIDSSYHGCFRLALGMCRGACTGKESPLRYNMRFAEAFAGRRVKKWPFPGPVVIAEESDGRGMSFLTDRWCILGHSGTGSPESGLPWSFDHDTYMILKRFIFDEGKRRRIRILPYTESAPAY